MEDVKGIELIDFFNNALIAKRKLDDRHCRYIFRKVCTALHKLHKSGVAHRDLKPENVLITEDYQIKLIDFGMGLPLSGREGKYMMQTRRGT